MVDFTQLLGRRADEAERPKPLPAGSYVFTIKGAPEFGESSKKKTPYVEFKATPVSPMEDVDMEALQQLPNWNQKEQRLTFYLTDDAIYRLSEFLEHCGVSISGRTYAEAIPETVNTQFVGSVSQSPSEKDPSVVYSNIDSTAPVS